MKRDEIGTLAKHQKCVSLSEVQGFSNKSAYLPEPMLPGIILKNAALMMTCLAGMLTGLALTSPAEKTNRPNIIYVMIDDAGYGMIIVDKKK